MNTNAFPNVSGYTITKELGRGGMAMVYLAHDNKFDTNVAIKVLNKEFVHNDNIRKRFLAEAKSMFKMSHPNIIKVTDLIEENDTVAFVMEYIEGETLKEYLDRKGKLNDDEIKTIFSQMLEAVGYVHEQNLVHRDIKPSNFMIDKKGKVKLMDFGIAKTLDASSSEYTQTGTGMQMGTPMYMSPEQIKSTKEVTFSADIYSLGVVLWQMVAGRRPYNLNELSIPEIQVSILKEPLPNINPSWDGTIQKCTQKDVGRRFSKCAEISQAINMGSVNADSPSDSTVLESNVVGAKGEKTNTSRYVFAGVFLIVALLLGIFFFGGQSLSNVPQKDGSEMSSSQKSPGIDSSVFRNDQASISEKPESNSPINATPTEKVNRKKTAATEDATAGQKEVDKEEEIVAFVSEEPVYPGGLEKLYAEIYKNITYPEMEQEQGISGTVYVSFVVEKNGTISGVKTERGVTGGPNLSKEAEKAVKKLGSFTPAKMNGKSVRYRYRIPVKFTLK
jgi:TonB family protein